MGLAIRVKSLETASALYGVLNREVRARMALQPIVELRGGRVIGYEALFRVDRFPQLNPVAMWDEASRAGVLEPLEEMVAGLCKAIRLPYGLLFVNVDSRATGTVERWRGEAGVVLELSEIARVPESMVVQLEEARIAYALDDMGAGFANTALAVRTRPAYIKVDRSIVDGCRDDDRKSSMIRHLARFAKDTRAHLIAEGVENRGDASTLRSLSVPLAQGYLFGRPKRMRQTRRDPGDRRR